MEIIADEFSFFSRSWRTTWWGLCETHWVDTQSYNWGLTFAASSCLVDLYIMGYDDNTTGMQQPKRMDTWIPGRYEKIDIDIFFAVHHPWEGDARQNLLAWAQKQGCPSSFTGSSSHSTIMIWLVVYLPVSTPLKNDGVRQLGWWHSQYMEIHF